ncbi:MAG TPA: glucose 1-dehydrogenase [Bacillus bacterium]|nr:glucose 1-dehydrogenase [Bacillus sp. (in: firmicutes)]
MKLKEKTAIITGAGSGMGKAIAKLFATEGAKVVVADINKEAIDSVVHEIKADGGQAVGVVANVAKQEDVDNMINTAVQTFASLDVLVNNAGIMDNFTPVGDVTDELWDRVIAVNLTGPLKVARATINIMEKQESGGVIINNASVGGLFGARGGAAYVASKHGLIGLTKNIAATYGTYGKIRANAIAPGGVQTNIQSTITAPHELGLKAISDMGSSKIGDPIQIAQVALFLASEESSFINGDVIKVDGGWTAR